jgi:hypothetical protein
METVRRELKSCPPDGFVVLRQLSYDEMLERRDGGIKILMEQSPGRNVDSKTSMQIANRWSNSFTFPRCIVEHNITDENSVPLNFASGNIEMVFKMLDPKLGAEIERYIDELNQEDESEDFSTVPNSSSQDENEQPKESSPEN